MRGVEVHVSERGVAMHVREWGVVMHMHERGVEVHVCERGVAMHVRELSAIKARLTLIFDHFYMQVLVIITGQKRHKRTFV